MQFEMCEDHLAMGSPLCRVAEVDKMGMVYSQFISLPL